MRDQVCCGILHRVAAWRCSVLLCVTRRLPCYQDIYARQVPVIDLAYYDRHQGEMLHFKAATHCNTLQHTATHFRHEGEILKLKAASEVKIKNAEIQLLRLQTQVCLGIHSPLYHRNTLHHSAPHCTALQHTTPHCSTYAKGQFSYMCVLQEQPIYNQAILTYRLSCISRQAAPALAVGGLDLQEENTQSNLLPSCEVRQKKSRVEARATEEARFGGDIQLVQMQAQMELQSKEAELQRVRYAQSDRATEKRRERAGGQSE